MLFKSPFEGFKIASWTAEIYNTYQTDIAYYQHFFFNGEYVMRTFDYNSWNWAYFGDNANHIWSINFFFYNVPFYLYFVIIFLIIRYFFVIEGNFINYLETFIIFIFLGTFTFLGKYLFFYVNLLEFSDYLVYNQTNLILQQSFLEFTFNKDIWGFFLILLFFFLLSSGTLSNLTLFPKGDLDYFSNGFYNFSLNLFSSTLDLKSNKDVQQFQEFFFKTNAIFGFIFVANSIGMLPFSTTITSNLMNTFFIALTVFIVVISTMILEKGFTHFLELFLPSGIPFFLIPLLVPIELLSYTFRLVSLSVRLFANMLAGHTLMKVFSGFSWSMLTVGGLTFTLLHYLPVLILFALTVLEIGVAAIQAYVFVVLSLLYIRDIFVGH